MWQCVKCREQIGDNFDACWSCGTSRDGVVPPDEPETHPVVCPRCRRKLDYVGTKSFHEGTRWGVLGDLGELFVKKERLDLYCCPRCGRVEFFVDGIGEQFRPH